ncbi:MAG: CO dehydrogenase/CO-methylating acetyl-CoA synthase complex subunit beta [Chloroflexi bacterium RBG_13_54_8]|nr:MAG: CO dehydrogenase/CO-methylating acetyl-CoA synthase complex subunit beta [Chloroflexi bacterium RBG_13_54_8]
MDVTEFHVDIGPQYEGEVVRKEDMHVEFGGPKIKAKFELVTLKSADEVEHEKVEIIGPDIKDMEEGSSHPLAILVDIAGSDLEKDMEPVIERRIHMYTNNMEGVYHMNQRNDIWIRLNKSSFKKGLNSLKEMGAILMFLFTSELSAIEKISITFVTDEKKVEELLPKVLKLYAARDERLRGMKEEDVDEFYGCVLCQSFAPTHVCVITPERIANCGAISWFDGRAAYKLDPEGPIFAVPKGDLLDEARGEYSGVNANSVAKSLGQYDQVYLHSAFVHPHTSCGCFQSICFYIPEVDAFGLVHRDFAGPTVIGESFSRMAGTTSGGRQVEGSLGMALEYLRSPKFIHADGGMYRMVWMPKEIKERYKEAIPADLYDKIATEEDVHNVEELQAFLDKVGHPWLKGEVELPA